MSGTQLKERIALFPLHGTILLLWAISMIYDFKNDQNELFNIIKP